MIRRAQLLGPGSRAANRVLAAGERIRDGLLRDNKVVPAILALLALLIFAWILTGALIGGEPDETGTGQVATHASQPQAAQDSESEGLETPALGVENRDMDSYYAFEKKDPFGNIGVEKSDDDGGSGGGSAGENITGDSNGDSDSNNGSGSNRNDGPSSRASDIRDSGGSGGDRRSGDAELSSGGGDGGQGGAGQGGAGQSGAGSGGSNNGLFDSSGDLAFP